MQSLDLTTCTAEEHAQTQSIITKEMARTHIKEAINSVLRWKIFLADERTLSVPFNHRQEVSVVLQHSR